MESVHVAGDRQRRTVGQHLHVVGEATHPAACQAMEVHHRQRALRAPQRRGEERTQQQRQGDAQRQRDDDRRAARASAHEVTAARAQHRQCNRRHQPRHGVVKRNTQRPRWFRCPGYVVHGGQPPRVGAVERHAGGCHQERRSGDANERDVSVPGAGPPRHQRDTQDEQCGERARRRPEVVRPLRGRRREQHQGQDDDGRTPQRRSTHEVAVAARNAQQGDDGNHAQGQQDRKPFGCTALLVGSEEVAIPVGLVVPRQRWPEERVPVAGGDQGVPGLVGKDHREPHGRNTTQRDELRQKLAAGGDRRPQRRRQTRRVYHDRCRDQDTGGTDRHHQSDDEREDAQPAYASGAHADRHGGRNAQRHIRLRAGAKVERQPRGE